jgi:hypothetical protein
LALSNNDALVNMLDAIGVAVLIQPKKRAVVAKRTIRT